MFRLTSVSRAALVVCMGSVALGATAQTAATTELKPIEVTGSRIKRMNTETASPIQVITREQIERSGAASVTEVLKSIPANNAGAFDENAVASFTPGAGGVSLRGLGAQATLVLINGRRVAPFGFASGGQQTFVDVNSIPLDAVERIETLLDGASAIYGSDAIAGVVNIILRKDFNGFTGSASLGRSSYSDANSPSFALTLGKGSLATDKYNFFGNFSHTQRDAVKASARPNTATADFRRFGLLDQRSSFSYPGTLYTVGGSTGGAFIAPVAGCTPLADGSSLNGRCIYDATQHTDIVAKTQRDALFLAGTVDLGSGNELFGDASFMRTKFLQESPSYSTNTYGPASVGTLPTGAIVLPVGHPQNPYTTESMIRYRFADVLHTTDVQSDTQRLVFGGRGNWLGWDAESALLYSRSSTGVSTNGFIRDSVLLDGVLDPLTGKASNSFNFGNPGANDAGLMSRLYPSLRDQGTTSTSSIDIHGSRELMQLAGGPLGLAIGAEFRRENFTSTPDALVAAGEISVLGASSADGNRNISALFAELSAPIFKTVETSLAARVDRYSDFGTAVTPKVSAKWKVVPTFAVRATYSEGFRAPALTELSSSPSRGFYSGIRDPLLCPVPDTENPNCDMSIEALSGSNPNLQPERSKSFTAGFVFEPSDSFSIVVDAYDVKRRDEIASIDPDYLLANEASYPGYVVRNSAGEIQSLNLQYTNLGSTHVSGIDIDVKSRFNLGEYGKLAVSGSYNSEPHYMVANVKGAPELDYAGTYMQPKERMKFGVGWDKGPWSTSATVNYTGSFLRAFTPSDLSCSYATTANPELCTISSWTTTDLFVGYKGFKNLDLGLNIQNIGNKQAPVDERLAGRYTLFGSGYHNQLGRYMTLRAKYVFW